MFNEKYKDKYGHKEVCDYEIYDHQDNLITTINTVSKNEFNILRKRCFLKFTDAVIDKKFYDYICKNMDFKGYIKAKTIFRELQTQDDHDVLIRIPKVKFISYKMKGICREMTTVDMVFEAFGVDELDGNVASMDIKD